MARISKKQKKIFVLDTNVILHDSGCLRKFQEHDVVIPITVVEELDKFKKGNEVLNFHAREFVRQVESLPRTGELFGEGVQIEKNLGNLIIMIDNQLDSDFKNILNDDKNDNYILNAVWKLSKDKSRIVTLVSKDVNIRLKAKAIGLLAEDYKTDQVKNVDDLYTGVIIVNDTPIEFIDRLASEKEIDILDFEFCRFENNQYIIFKCGNKSLLAVNDSFTGKIRKIDKINASGITPRNAEQIFALDALMNDNYKLVSLSSLAGSGKSLLALAAALENKKAYRQIFLAKSTVPLSNKDLGFLPGDLKEKLDPYMQSFYDNLGVISEAKPSIKLKELLEQEKIIISPLAYIRGRSLNKIIFIIDEAQNLTPHEIKTIITRAGEGTKIIFLGDIHQIDHPYLDAQSNGLTYLIDKMKGEKLYAHITLQKGERSELSDMAARKL